MLRRTARLTVERVVDGDTIDVVVGGREERVRLIGIDTPEVTSRAGRRSASGPRRRRSRRRCCRRARRSASSATSSGRDDYGRLLAYVCRAADDMFVNVEIVRQGFARPLTIRPNDTFAAAFVAAATAAEAAGLGLWGACGG